LSYVGAEGKKHCKVEWDVYSLAVYRESLLEMATHLKKHTLQGPVFFLGVFFD
jgi:hypothetical protein